MKDKPAFPYAGPNDKGPQLGMTLFEYTAIQAMKGAISNNSLKGVKNEVIAKASCDMAEAMIKELNNR